MDRIAICITIFLSISCSKDDSVNGLGMSDPVVQRNGRTLAMDVNEADDGDFVSAFDLAQELGVNEIKQSWDWDGMETPSGFDFTFPDIANIFFPLYNTPVSLVFRPINTNLKSIPDELKSLELDDPLLISRFNAFLDSIHAHTPDLSVNAIYIDNEIDIYLGLDADQWTKFTTFFQLTSAHARELWGIPVKIGTIATLEALNQEVFVDLIRPIHEMSDVVAVTYYPLEGNFQMKDPGVVVDDFDRLVELYGNMEIRFTECGYSTSLVNGSSEEKQRQFVEEVFKAWDRHEATIRHIDFTWLHDLSQAQTDLFKDIYGLSSNTFGEYLRTLGLRTHDGQDKPGFVELKNQAQARGW